LYCSASGEWWSVSARQMGATVTSRTSDGRFGSKSPEERLVWRRVMETRWTSCRHSKARCRPRQVNDFRCESSERERETKKMKRQSGRNEALKDVCKDGSHSKMSCMTPSQKVPDRLPRPCSRTESQCACEETAYGRQ
jgi:hypothetical protein